MQQGPQWYYGPLDAPAQPAGPVTIQQLAQLWNEGKVKKDSLVWRLGMPAQTELQEVPGLVAQLQQHAADAATADATRVVRERRKTFHDALEQLHTGSLPASQLARNNLAVDIPDPNGATPNFTHTAAPPATVAADHFAPYEMQLQPLAPPSPQPPPPTIMHAPPPPPPPYETQPPPPTPTPPPTTTTTTCYRRNPAKWPATLR